MVLSAAVQSDHVQPLLGGDRVRGGEPRGDCDSLAGGGSMMGGEGDSP